MIVGLELCRKYFYIGKLKKRFLDDEIGNVYAVELDCLKLRVGNGTILESYPVNSKGDVFIFDIHDIITTAKVTLLRGTKWDVPDYVSLEKRFQKLADEDRAATYKASMKKSN